ncbi:ABC transporter ATP-binding protein [Halostreptopolyspora alba]|uniref:ABC transporter ATP-binding protein n=1 Tax=Halostreptopolyspora alba TaxID=2487137 RepID=A0A3N0EFJ0_9ACTN|nr:ABC transporter ATP-binding protein [Nocardiopsaceae bacterium YIM 96095]
MAEVSPHPGVAKPDPILVADGLRRSFGGLTAVDVERLQVQRGTITALIGPNGAGKSTLFNVLTGFDRVDTGSWTFEGGRLNGLAGHQVARRGMVRTFQLTKALTRLTVMENMLLAAPGQSGERLLGSFLRWSWARQEDSNRERAEALLERFRLAHMRDEIAGSLSGGQRKLLEMARALMVRPSMVMLDEPMAGVNPVLVESLLEHISALRDEGTTVLFVEHDMDVIMGISDWIVVLAEGRVIAEGRPEDIRSDQVVIDAYLGAHHDEAGRGSGDEAAEGIEEAR